MKPILVSLLLFTSLITRAQSVELTIQTDKEVYTLANDTIRLVYRIDNRTKDRITFICSGPWAQYENEWHLHIFNDSLELESGYFVNAPWKRPFCKIEAGEYYQDTVVVKLSFLHPTEYNTYIIDMNNLNKRFDEYSIVLNYDPEHYKDRNRNTKEIGPLRSNELKISYLEY